MSVNNKINDKINDRMNQIKNRMEECKLLCKNLKDKYGSEILINKYGINEYNYDNTEKYNELTETVVLRLDKIEEEVLNKMDELKEEILSIELEKKISEQLTFELKKIMNDFKYIEIPNEELKVINFSYMKNLAPDNEDLRVGQVTDDIKSCCEYEGYIFSLGLWSRMWKKRYFEIEIKVSYDIDGSEKENYSYLYKDAKTVMELNSFYGVKIYYLHPKILQMIKTADELREKGQYDEYQRIHDEMKKYDNNSYRNEEKIDEIIRFGHEIIKIICKLNPEKCEYEEKFEKIFSKEGNIYFSHLYIP